MRVVVASDEDSPVLEVVAQSLRRHGHEVARLAVGASWPEVGRSVGEAVASGEAEAGVVCCWTGTGVTIAANKVPGVRAALCVDAETARGARRWNDANVLALSLRIVSEPLAGEILEAFLAADADPGEAETIAPVERAR